MKTLLLAAVLAAVSTPAMAQGWGYGNTQMGNCGSNYQNRSAYQNYGRAGYSNGYSGMGYGSGVNYGAGYGSGYSARDPWAHRSVTPSLQQRGVYDPVHGDFHPTANMGYGSPFPRMNFDDRHYGRGGY